MASAEDTMMETPRPAVPDSPLTEAPSAKSMPAKKAKLNMSSPLAYDAAMDDYDDFAPMQPLADAAQASGSTEGTVPRVEASQEISRGGSRPPKAGLSRGGGYLVISQIQAFKVLETNERALPNGRG